MHTPEPLTPPSPHILPCLPARTGQPADDEVAAHLTDHPPSTPSPGRAGPASTRHERQQRRPKDSVDNKASSDAELNEVVKKNTLQEVSEIETEFKSLRQRLNEERRAQLEAEAAKIREGNHPALRARLEVIESRHRERLDRADAWRRARMRSCDHWMAAKESQFDSEYHLGVEQMHLGRIDTLYRQLWKIKLEKGRIERGKRPSSWCGAERLTERIELRRKKARDRIWRVQSEGVHRRPSGLTSQEVMEDVEFLRSVIA